MSSKNKALSRRWFEEVWNDRDDDALAELLAPDAIGHLESGVVKGVRGFRKARDAMLAANPGLRFEVEDVVADGDGNVAIRWSAAGKGKGRAAGSGRPKATIRGLTWHRFRDGRLVEAWEHRDHPGTPRRKTPPENVRLRIPGLSERLRQLRLELFGEHGGPEMARKLGIPARTYYNYETGVTVPAEVLLKVIELTRVNPRWLVSDQGPMWGEIPRGQSSEELLREALEELEGPGSGPKRVKAVRQRKP